MYDRKKLDELKGSLEKWEKTSLQKALAQLPERREEFITTSSEPINRLYSPLDVAELDYAADLGLPGEYPYTRGVHPTLHRSKLWTMRMFAGFGTAEETNKRFKYLLEQGQTGLSIAFDLATLMGYDTDQPEALGEFGKCGVAISSLKDMEILLEGIQLDKVSSSMTINSPAAIIWAMYIAAAENQGVRLDQLRGTTQNDILKEFIAQKEFIYPPAPSMRLVVDTMEFGAQKVPQWNTISISGYHIREAGSTAAQELAFTLADGLEYVRWGIARGMDVDNSRRGFPSSSTRTTISLKRLPSIAPRDGFGRGRCARRSRRKIRARGCFVSTHKQRAPVSPRNSLKIMWSAWRCRRLPLCSAELKACTPTPWMRRWLCHPNMR